MGGILAGSVVSFYPARLLAKTGKTSAIKTKFDKYFSIDVAEGPNPWTNLNFNNKKSNFQFAILADQTSYIDWAVFKDSINKVNLLQPEFVMTVGDLIEGNSHRPEDIDKQWDRFDAEVDRLDMPFFYVPGNHDLRENNKHKTCEQKWSERLGRTYHHFKYNDVLFLCVSTEDLNPNATYTWANSHIGKEQVAYFEKVIADNKDVRWTFVFMHEPLFEEYCHNYNKNGWEGIEAALQGRKYTVLAGHTHIYSKRIKKGQKYITLATTGAGAGHPKTSPHFGQFDHITLCTMKDDGPVFANIEVDGIWDENVRSDENSHLVNTVIGKNFAITCSPIKIKTDTFKKITAEITIENNTDYEMTLDGHFDQHETLRPFPYSIKTEMPAHSKKVVKLQIGAQPAVSVKDLKPLVFKKTVYCRPDTRPTIPYKGAFEIKIEKA